MAFIPLAVACAVFLLCLAVWTDRMAVRFASLAALMDWKACFFCKSAWVFTFWEETGEVFAIRGAVFTIRFPASLIVFSASGLILMLLPAPVRPFFALVCPVWADVPPLPVSLSNGAVTAVEAITKAIQLGYIPPL